MDIGQWWPKLSETSRSWLLDNAGSPLAAEVSADIVAAGGPSGAELTDEDVDWLGAVANDEAAE